MRLDLPYGRLPYPLDLGNRVVSVLRAPPLPEPLPLDVLLARALERPFGPSLRESSRAAAHVTVIVSDATRTEPALLRPGAAVRFVPVR